MKGGTRIMQSVETERDYGDLRAECPFCGHYRILGKGRGDVCVHLREEDPDGRYLLFDNRR
jgi:DNA-directed RNA polymerase subunit RPC12/RpoP